MRPLLVIPVILALCCALSACAPAGGQAKPAGRPESAAQPEAEDVPPAEWEPQPAQPIRGDAGTPHDGTQELAALQVYFDSPINGDRRDVSPEEFLDFEITLCNTGAAPLEGVMARVIFGSHAELIDSTYADFTPLPAALAPAGPECGESGKALRLPLQLKSTGKLKPGQRVSVSPIVVVKWRDAVETYECPFKIIFRAPKEESAAEPAA